ncbi:H-NS histone family protein [Azohydromonas australica]|uniref:H-NS histone family protein n=1 Tax=Azohydromonas australica TaxID=364039 RepID=UPI000420A99D|nr:H-NS histone family protein [Azohydromonas australica]
MHNTEEIPTGWVKPVAKPTPDSLKTRVAELRAELAEAEAQLREMEDGERLEALVKVRNLMRAFQLTPMDLGLVPVPKRRGRPPKTAAGQEQLRLPAV